MATPTMERQRTTEYRRVASSRTRGEYREMRAVGNAVAVPDYARPFPKPSTRPVAKPAPKTTVKPSVSQEERNRAYAKAKKKRLLRTFCQIAGVAIMCSLMIYRYAMILETNDKITKLNQQIAAMEYDNQFLAAKLDSALELGALESYAAGELGMMRPETSQVFYVDINMGDSFIEETETDNRTLQGTPGALMHAIRVLK